MNTINRIKGPEIKSIENLSFPSYKRVKLDNGIPVYILSGGTQDIFKVELFFNAGRKYENRKGVARLCNFIMKEGIQYYNSEQLAEFWDFHGAILRSYSDLDVAGHSILGLTRHAENLLDRWIQIFNCPSFNQEEIDTNGRIFSEKLKIEISKNDVLSYRLFTAQLYGYDHQYGFNTHPKDFINQKAEELKDHWLNYYGTSNATAIISGKIDENIQKTLLDKLSLIKNVGTKIEMGEMLDISTFPSPILINHSTNNELQTSLKMGNVCIDSHHDDYTGFSTLVHILGGYFGSRLMSNLREEQGLCYNIYATIDRMAQSSYFFISADLNVENLELAIAGIKDEIRDLQEELISEEELHMVRSYIKGNILSSLDGPIRCSEILKSYLSHDLPFDYFRVFLHELELITPEKLRDIANNYLNTEKMTILTMGP